MGKKDIRQLSTRGRITSPPPPAQPKPQPSQSNQQVKLGRITSPPPKDKK